MAQKKITDLQLIAAVTDTLNIPSDDTLQSYRFTGLQMKNYILSAGSVDSAKLAAEVLANRLIPGMVTNGIFAVSVAANAATIALKTTAGADPSSTDPVRAVFDNGDGTFTIRSVTAALSITIPSSASLGHPSAVMGAVYVYLVDNAGTISMAVSSVAKQPIPQNVTAISGAATTSALFGTALTSKPIALIGVWESTQSTAGNWASATGTKTYNVPWNWFPYQYFEAEPTSVQATAAADTWIDAEASPTFISLPPGKWLMGFNVSLYTFRISGGLASFPGNVGLFDAANALVGKMISFSSSALDSSYNFRMEPHTRTAIIDTTGSNSYKLRIRSHAANTVATVELVTSNLTGGLTNPDNYSVFYARRIG